MKLYLAGPMRGIPDLNLPEFRRVTKLLRMSGHVTFSPGELLDNEDRSALETEMVWICRNAEGIALLKGWEESKGACAEQALGLALGILTRKWEEWI